MGDWPLTKVVNHIRPGLRILANGRPLVFHGHAVDTRGLGMARALFIVGERDGGPFTINWGLWENDSPTADGFTLFEATNVVYCAVSDAQGLGALCIPLGVESRRKRWLRARVEIFGRGWIVLGVLLEFMPAERRCGPAMGRRSAGGLALPGGPF